MSACNFNIPFSASPEELIAKAKRGINGGGGAFNGDAASGNFKMPTPLGAIEGSYTILNSVIKIAITDKPFFVSCTRIQEELQKQLEG